MTPASSAKRFRELIATRGKKLSSLTPEEGIELMLEFCRDCRVVGSVIENHGDALLYQWGTYDWGDGEFFEFDITRQFIEGAAEDDNIHQLQLTFRFKPTQALHSLGDANKWCPTLADLTRFLAFIRVSGAYQAVAKLRAVNVELWYEGV